MGLDGVVLSWVNYEAELAHWVSDVLPVMEQAGLGRPYVSANARSLEQGQRGHAVDDAPGRF
jgi:hypothetical protein